MFTGIIETIGTIQSASKVGGDLKLVVGAEAFADREVALGDSIAVNGACLTVVAQNGADFTFDVSVESLNHTLMGNWTRGKRVNLEMAMLPSSRFGGHIVSGHVDGLATVVQLNEDARSWRIDFRLPHELKKYVARKGSITINGISLTVNAVDDDLFSVNIIPHTFEVTTLADIEIGDRVHIEVDMIARYVERLLNESSDAKASKLSKTFLNEHGFS